MHILYWSVHFVSYLFCRHWSSHDVIHTFVCASSVCPGWQAQAGCILSCDTIHTFVCVLVLSVLDSKHTWGAYCHVTCNVCTPRRPGQQARCIPPLCKHPCPTDHWNGLLRTLGHLGWPARCMPVALHHSPQRLPIIDHCACRTVQDSERVVCLSALQHPPTTSLWSLITVHAALSGTVSTLCAIALQYPHTTHHQSSITMCAALSGTVYMLCVIAVQHPHTTNHWSSITSHATL